MKLFKSLSIRHKILTIPIVSIFLFLIYLWINISSTAKNAERVVGIRDIHFPILQLATENQTNLKNIEAILLSAVMAGEVDDIDSIKLTVDEMEKNFSTLKTLDLSNLSKIGQSERLLKAYLKDARGASTAVIEELDTASSLGDLKKKSLNAITNHLNGYQASSYQNFASTIDEVKADSDSAVSMGIVIALITIVLLVLVALAIAKLVEKNVCGVAESLKDIAQGEGDLTKRIAVGHQGKDEVSMLIHWFNTFVGKLQSTISQVVDTAVPMADVSKDLLEITNITETSIQNQLQDCQEVNQAMSEMQDTVNHIVQSAAAAASAASGADNAAKQSQEIVNTSVGSINDLALGIENAAKVIEKLEQDSNEVGAVLEVIKSIADQTNLLALNAAIEAARAGEHGRGFAVVADEVRALASKTHQSTETIQNTILQLQSAAQQAVTVIGESQDHAQQSVAQISLTGNALEEITESVSTINDMNTRIASATEEQQNTLVGIINTTDKITANAQDSSQQAERLTQISSGVERLSGDLHSVTKQFIV